MVFGTDFPSWLGFTKRSFLRPRTGTGVVPPVTRLEVNTA
jgi:hypothetical protein